MIVGEPMNSIVLSDVLDYVDTKDAIIKIDVEGFECKVGLIKNTYIKFGLTEDLYVKYYIKSKIAFKNDSYFKNFLS